MDLLKVEGVEIGGVTACLPEKSLDNREACRELYGDAVDNLIKATGVKSRRVVSKGTTALDLGVEAAKELLNNAKVSTDEIGAVICVTFTPERLMPADACLAQARLGLPNHCAAFDVNMACSGYGYGLFLAANIARSLGKKVLLLDGDVQTAYLSQQDKATVPVMADVGTATLLCPNPNASPWYFSFYTDGSRQNVLYIPAGGSKEPTTQESLVCREVGTDGSKRRDVDIFMDGFAVFRFVALDASKFLGEFMRLRGISSENIEAFVPHQANIYMIEQLTKKLKISPDKMWKSGNVYGNPGSGSVPLTIAANASSSLVNQRENRVMFAGFGGGLSISVGEIYLDRNAYFGLVEYVNREKSEKI